MVSQKVTLLHKAVNKRKYSTESLKGLLFLTHPIVDKTDHVSP